MKTLTQAWELIQLLSSLHFLSPTLVRAVNPQNYTFYCSYNPNNRRYLSVGMHNIVTHIDMCNEESCEYYIRISKNELNRKIGKAVSTSIRVAEGFFFPLTTALSSLNDKIVTPSKFSDLLIDLSINTNVIANLKAIEDELKLKWENEQAGQNSTSD